MTLHSLPRFSLIPGLLVALGCASAQRSQMPTPQLPVPQTSTPQIPAPKVPTPQSPAAKPSSTTGGDEVEDGASGQEKGRAGQETGAGADKAVGTSESQGTSGGARTPDEHRDALDQKLGGSLSAFDAMLLKEQQQAAQKRAEHATPAGSEGGGAGDERRGETTGASQGRGDEDRATGSSRGGDRSSGGGRPTIAAPEGSPSVPGSENVPADVGDGRDDDVVARQIREAATQEPDAAIREKLWDEYRRYKASRSGSGT